MSSKIVALECVVPTGLCSSSKSVGAARCDEGLVSGEDDRSIG